MYVVRDLRNDTEIIIAVNPTKCKIFRKVASFEDGEVVGYTQEYIQDETVRIIKTVESVHGKDNNGNILTIKKYLLIAKWNSIINKDDILLDSNERTFKVEDVNKQTYEGTELDNVHRIDCSLKLIDKD